MEMVDLKCSTCGGKLSKVEGQENEYVCLHCKNTQIVKKESLVSLFKKSENIPEEYYTLLKEAERFILIEEYVNAVKKINSAIEIENADFLSWWLLVKAKLLYNIKHAGKDEKTRYQFEKIFNEYKVAYNFASDDAKVEIEKEYKTLCKTASGAYGKTIEYLEPTFGEQKSVKGKIALNIALISICALFVLIYSFLSENVTSEVLDGFCTTLVGISVIVIVLAALSLSDALTENKIINKIKQSDKTSVDELLGIEKDRESVLEYITEIINKKYLTGYKFEKSYIIKVDEKEYKKEQE